MTESEFLTLIDQHKATIDKVCSWHRCSAQDHQDLFQEIVLRAWKNQHSFEGRSPFDAWLYSIARNTANESYRKKGVIIADVPLSSQIPDEYMETGEREEQLTEAIKHLDEDDQMLVSLYLDDRSYREIGKMTGNSENNVAVRISRIKTKIKKLLKIKQ